MKNWKKWLFPNLPYLIAGLLATNLGEAWRLSEGNTLGEKILGLSVSFPLVFRNFLPSLHPADLLVGLSCGLLLRLAVYVRGRNSKNYRHNVEYGSARWGTEEDITPYMDPVFENNLLLTNTERLTMSSRPADPKFARNKNVLVIGGSGSGKTRFFVKPNLMQCSSLKYPCSFVITDPKG